MRYEDWEAEVPCQIRDEAIWKFFGYRKAMFLYDVCWKDCETLLKHPLGKAVARQLIRSVGSVSANIKEGYGRGYGKDRLYFLRISIGSARESKGWYYRAKELLSPDVIEHRLNLIGEVIALLVTELSKSCKSGKSANQQMSKSVRLPCVGFADSLDLPICPICSFIRLQICPFADSHTERKTWQNLETWS